MTELLSRILPGLSYQEYVALAGERSSNLKAMDVSAKHYVFRSQNHTETRALKLGSAAHAAVLEPARFATGYVVWDLKTKSGRAKSRSGKDWDAFEEEHADKVILTEREYLEAKAIRDAVRTDPVALRYLAQGQPEVSMQWPMLGRQCKARVDWLTTIDSRAAIVGLKSARDVREFLFGAQAAKLFYHIQWAWYYDGYVVITGEAPMMIEITVESVAPYDVVVYEIPNEIIVEGREKYMDLFKGVAECHELGQWPGVGRGALNTLSFPTWAFTQPFADDLSSLGLVDSEEQ